MNYKNCEKNISSNTEPVFDNEFIFPEIEILEEQYDFESDIFVKLIEAFSFSFDSGDFLKCKIILLKEIIPFFQSRIMVFEKNGASSEFFISIFKRNRIIDISILIIQSENQLLIEPTTFLLSLLSSLNTTFCRFITSNPYLIDLILNYSLIFDAQLFENCIILYNNSLQFCLGKVEPTFLLQLFDKIILVKLDTNITLNFLINLVRYSELTIEEFPFIMSQIFQGFSESLFLDSMNLIYFSYQSEINRQYLLPFLPQIIIQLESSSANFFNQKKLLPLYFKILYNILNSEENDNISNQIKSIIFENFDFKIMKNLDRKNDSQILQNAFPFLSKSPPEFIIKYSIECFKNEIFCLYFIIDCINDCDLGLKRSGLTFLPIFLKATNPEFLSFLIDNNFVNNLISLIESDDSENQKVSLRFLNTIIDTNLYFQSYSKQLFEKFTEEDIIENMNDLIISSDDDEIVSLVENVIKYIEYITSDE